MVMYAKVTTLGVRTLHFFVAILAIAHAEDHRVNSILAEIFFVLCVLVGTLHIFHYYSDV